MGQQKQCAKCGELHKTGKILCRACMQTVTAFNSARRRRYYEAGLCSHCGGPRETDAMQCDACYALSRLSRQRPRLAAIAHYGGQCACCGEMHIEFLHLDHVDGGGGVHHKSLKTTIYQTLKKAGYPSGYRVLCANCNMAIGFYGYCPHHPEQVVAPRSVRRGRYKNGK